MVMQTMARQLELQAAQCVRLAAQCERKSAERTLRLLAVDLMLEAEREQRAELEAQFAELRNSTTALLARQLA